MSQDDPNNILAKQIAKALLDAGLIEASTEEAFVEGICKGTYKDSDWKSLLEKTINNPISASRETQDTTN